MPIRRPTSYNDFAAYIRTPATVQVTSVKKATIPTAPMFNRNVTTTAAIRRERLVEYTKHMNRTKAMGIVPAYEPKEIDAAHHHHHHHPHHHHPHHTATMRPNKRISPHVAAVIKMIESRKQVHHVAVPKLTTATIKTIPATQPAKVEFRVVRDHYGNKRYIYF